jgi:hypothetical protein
MRHFAGYRVAILPTAGAADGNTGEETLVAGKSKGSLGTEGGDMSNTACIAEGAYAFEVCCQYRTQDYREWRAEGLGTSPEKASTWFYAVLVQPPTTGRKAALVRVGRLE